MAALQFSFVMKREISNHVDSNAPMLLGVAISFVALSTIIVALRCWIRHFWLHAFSIDDVIMIGALVRFSKGIALPLIRVDGC